MSDDLVVRVEAEPCYFGSRPAWWCRAGVLRLGDGTERDARRIADALAPVVRAAEERGRRMAPPLPGLLPPAELDRLARLAGAATPGPWHAHHTDDALSMNCHTVSTSATEPDTEDASGIDARAIVCGTLVQSGVRIAHAAGRWEQDAAFIAAAREAVPALLAHIETQEAYLRDAGTDGRLSGAAEAYRRGWAEALDAAARSLDEASSLTGHGDHIERAARAAARALLRGLRMPRE